MTPIASAGEVKQQIHATFDPSFFALVSEHLYSSPNKAFEELVTNSWDADASNVYVQISSNLHSHQSAISILDDGRSMDINGFEKLWAIAKSEKRNAELTGRKKIGKFGIGKLATYLLCNELTYICKHDDGIIRLVTMDYRMIDSKYDSSQNNLVLNVRVIGEDELQAVLSQYDGGDKTFDLIKKGIPSIKSSQSYYNEYGGEQLPLFKSKETWTLAILTSLKKEGCNIEVGRTKWMLRTALPLGDSMKIKFNEDEILPSKSDVPICEQWQVGPELPFDTFNLDNDKIISFTKKENPYKCILIPGVGEITGTITLFDSSIASGKSNAMDVSNGCFVNVRGRVINTNGIGQFSMGSSGQGTFAKFRAAIRVDSLDSEITIQRDTFKESKELSIVIAFLIKAFNYVRNIEENEKTALLITASKARKGSLDAVPLHNLASQLHASLNDLSHLPPFIDTARGVDAQKIAEWLASTNEGEQNAIAGIEMVDGDPKEQIARYDLTSKILNVNKSHPFVQEHSGSSAERAVVEDMIMVNLLTDSYLLNNGVSPKVIQDMNTYRDISQRTLAQLRRNSPILIIRLLEEWRDEATPLEEIVGDALVYLGYSVERLAQSGQPEGLATAFISPQVEGAKKLYRFTYDAKSTKRKKVQTGNVHIAGLGRHRENHNANYSLVVGPDFQKGALEQEAEANGVTPMKTGTLGKLVALTINYGPLNLAELEEIFVLRDPDAVEDWVNKAEQKLKKQHNFTIANIVQAINSAKEPQGLDVLSASVVAQHYRQIIKNDAWPLTSDLSNIVLSLALLAPRTIAVDPKDSNRIFLLAPPEQLLAEVKRQVAELPSSAKISTLVSID